MVDGRRANIIGKERLCPMCDGEMRLARCEDRSDLFKWKCRRQEKGKRHKTAISIRKGSWFEKSKMTLEEILKLTYWWCQDLDQAQIKQELGLAKSTGVDWDSFCREVCEFTLLESRGRLGGEEKIVQIDESKFGKRKYHRGHHVEGQRVFGGIEQNSRKCFLMVVEKRMKQRCYLLFRNGLSREQLSYQIAGKRTVIWRNRVLPTEQ